MLADVRRDRAEASLRFPGVTNVRPSRRTLPHVTAPGRRHPKDVNLFLERALSRLFRPVARVEPREAITAAIMMLIAFLLLTAYYLLKTVREPLILLQG